MKLFKEWLFKEDYKEEIKELKKLAFDYAHENNLPEPTEYLDSGSEAMVFNTTNSNIVVRVAKDENIDGCEKVIESPSIQAMDGVVKLFKGDHYKNHKISFKEKVDTNWENYFTGEKKEKIMNNIHNLVYNFYANEHDIMKKRIKELSLIPETRNLALTISRIPSVLKDMHDGNLGISKKGNLVLIDC
jgi:hypothetical protein